MTILCCALYISLFLFALPLSTLPLNSQQVANLAVPVLAHPVEGVGAEDVDAFMDDDSDEDEDVDGVEGQEEGDDANGLGPGAQVWPGTQVISPATMQLESHYI